ncbi:MAG: hypothetical protein AYK22_07200 [Thermoplasmatales archaeon SG8-52-3]|nr:MAG: hypothetical protein AYK22_07200 [Thermoplasmatales archaeon SG8-52-3]
MVVTTPIHEAAHWVMSDLDPYIEPIEFHLFDDKSFQNNNNVLSSALGYVVVKERYPGAFEDRPFWFDLLQEIICVSIQILITLLTVIKLLKLLIEKNLKTIKTA